MVTPMSRKLPTAAQPPSTLPASTVQSQNPSSAKTTCITTLREITQPAMYIVSRFTVGSSLLIGILLFAPY